ncbi:hypothetical protein OF001_U240079 [Pseudomonas sp. OF001]|nr:hypothetical protein OF001_U240079 [Pseudomonas sp. OF001]
MTYIPNPKTKLSPSTKMTTPIIINN